MAQVAQAPNGTWFFVTDAPRSPEGGRRQVKRRGFATKQIALNELAKYEPLNSKGTTMRSLFKNIRHTRETKRLDRARFTGCVEHVCRADMLHTACIDCGGLTDRTQLRIDPKTKRRFVAQVCTTCALKPNPQQDRLRTARTRDDWEKVTDPVQSELIRAGEMPEQMPGLTRAAIRAFRESTKSVAVVPNANAATLNYSIAALGLEDEMYAETRGTQTVLRKVA